jgi:hypothetical protein
MKTLEESIEWTLKYFAFFAFPLTAFEIWKWQRGTTYSYTQILEGLRRSQNTQRQGIFHGHRLGAIEFAVPGRHAHYRDALAKYRRVRWYVYYLARLPWVEGVAFCNNLPFHNTKDGSDIDLFLLVKPGTLWKTRLFALLPLRLFRLRPGEAKQHPIDVSFLLATDETSLEHLQIDRDDAYLSMWVTALSPVFERTSIVFEAFWEENTWATSQFSQARTGQRAPFWRARQTWSLPLFFSESFARSLQKRMLPGAITSPGSGASIVMNRAMLKFHQNDRREMIRDALCE